MDDHKSEVPELHQHAPISGEQYAFPELPVPYGTITFYLSRIIP